MPARQETRMCRSRRQVQSFPYPERAIAKDQQPTPHRTAHTASSSFVSAPPRFQKAEDSTPVANARHPHVKIVPVLRTIAESQDALRIDYAERSRPLAAPSH